MAAVRLSESSRLVGSVSTTKCCGSAKGEKVLRSKANDGGGSAGGSETVGAISSAEIAGVTETASCTSGVSVSAMGAHNSTCSCEKCTTGGSASVANSSAGKAGSIGGTLAAAVSDELRGAETVGAISSGEIAGMTETSSCTRAAGVSATGAGISTCSCKSRWAGGSVSVASFWAAVTSAGGSALAVGSGALSGGAKVASSAATGATDEAGSGSLSFRMSRSAISAARAAAFPEGRGGGSAGGCGVISAADEAMAICGAGGAAAIFWRSRCPQEGQASRPAS